nr:unnamed protein product [Spirometra erinaceieuropaei]
MSLKPNSSRLVFRLFILLQLLSTSFCAAQKRDFTYVLPEESEIGTFVGNILLDSGLEGVLPKEDFDIQLYEDRTVGLFRVEKHTGKLFVAQRIDRETICPQKNNVPFAVESSNLDQFDGLGQPEDMTCRIELSAYLPPEHWVNIIVIVKDINDHAPKFQQVLPNSMILGTSKSPYVLYISEGVNIGYHVPLIGATDEDCGTNGVQTYALTGRDFDKSTFSVNYQPPYELNLVVLKKLDHEKKTSYSGVLTACDGGKPSPLCATQLLTIFVTDVNDNKPVFERALYEVKISENMTVGSVVTTVHATDLDSGNFGKIRYQIGQIYDQSQSNYFELDEWTGEVRVRIPLQAKFASRVRIPIIAQDGGPIPKVGNTLLQIDVEDVNNHAPSLIITPMITPNGGSLVSSLELSNRVQLWLEENQPVGTQIGIIRTGDDDVGVNGEVTCNLISNNTFFILTHSNSARERKIYSLQSNIRFDHEQTQNPSLTADIECSDAGTPPLVTRQGIQVNIQDVNEYHAYFPEDATSYFAEISEDVQPGTFVIAVRAVDKDSTAIMHFVLSEEAQKYFRVDEFTGRIHTIEHLDREQTSEIRFAVRVHDEDDMESTIGRGGDEEGSRANTANVTVRITDVNDNSPRLEGRRNFQVFENRPAYSDMIGQLMASDPDAGENGTVKFKLVSVMSAAGGVSNGTFEINPLSGKIYARISLDREVFAQYHLRVEVSDTGRPLPRKVTETVIIDVLDENDNKPVWKAPQKLYDAVSIHSISSIVYVGKTVLDRNRMDYLAFVNVSEPPTLRNPLMRLFATDADSKPNANLSFHLLLSNYYDESFSFAEDGKLTINGAPKQLNSTQSVYIDQQAWTLGLLPNAPIKHGLQELFLRLSDNGNPPLHSDVIMFLHLKGRSSSHLASLLGDLFRVGSSGNSKSILLLVMSILTVCSLVLLMVICFLRRRSCANESGTIMTRNGNFNTRSEFDDKDSGVGSGLPKVFAVPEFNGGTHPNGHADVDGWARGQFYLTHHWLASPAHFSGLGAPPLEMSNSIHSPAVNNCASVNVMQARDENVEPTFCHVDARATADRSDMFQFRFCKPTGCSGHPKDSSTANSRVQGACLQVDLEVGSADSGHGASEEEANILEARKGYFGGLAKLGCGHRIASTDPFKASARSANYSAAVSTFGQRPFGLDGNGRHFSETYDASTLPCYPQSILLEGPGRDLPTLSFGSERFSHNRPVTPDPTLVGQPQFGRTAVVDPPSLNPDRQTIPRSTEALSIDRRALC